MHHRAVVSLRASILALLLVAQLPAFVFAAYLIYENYVLSREQVNSQSILVARNLSARLDREFSAIESGLKVLATSDELAAGDLRKFHQRAREALKGQIVYNYVLTDTEGRQVLNTVRPFGELLPATGTPKELAAVVSERRTVLTDLFTGPVVKKPVVAMGVPVQVGDTVRYSLNIGLDPRALNKVLSEEEIPPQWLAVILDSNATIVARTRRPEDFMGQKAVPQVAQRMMTEEESTLETTSKEGTPVISSHHRSKTWRWIVAVGVDRAVLDAELNRGLLRLMVWGVVAIVLAWGLATLVSSYLVRNLQALNHAARDLAQGKQPELPLGGFRETRDIAHALHIAAEAMRDSQYRASHDPLTGIANRVLFEDLARHQWRRARRERSGYAMLAIDLDNFKLVNDTQGHAAGDQVLCEVARRMLNHVRDFDVAARVGGDEFLVMLASANQVLALEVAQRIIEALSLPYEATDIAVSASIGIAVYPIHGEDNEELLKHADQALYRAKREGRRRAVTWEA